MYGKTCPCKVLSLLPAVNTHTGSFICVQIVERLSFPPQCSGPCWGENGFLTNFKLKKKKIDVDKNGKICHLTANNTKIGTKTEIMLSKVMLPVRGT